MRSLGTRRAALVAGVATVGVIALAGCSAGQVAETAMLDTPIAGVNANAPDGSVFVRNAQVAYDGIEGYKQGENAPLELSLFNQSEKDVTVTISSTPVKQPQVISATKVGFVSAPAPVTETSPSTPASADPSGSSSPSTPASAEPTTAPTPTVTTAEITIKALGSAVFKPTDAKKLQLVGLSEALQPGERVNLVFHFSTGGDDLTIQAPVAIPLTPASRAPGLDHENTEE
ncbi:hypothetical protein [Actinoplanes sp. HUAS TT8]|uniref:hypothetical protein n=1 Tax=Actinoplanes sp. HUAS TT8 TaxID=3447453 RepID=UPI003F51CF4D